jgi:tRNA pseudouridine38-40 synthase
MKSARNIRLIISYDGSNYSGWQRQKIKTGVGIQNIIEKKLSELFQEEIETIGAGRTDALTHAFRYIMNFHCHDEKIKEKKLPFILNCLLPKDIRVLSAERVSPDFHSRFSVTAREYVYLYLNTKTILPHFRNYFHYGDTTIDFDQLKRAVRLFAGVHSFRYYCGSYRDKTDFTREIHYFRVKETKIFGYRAFIFFIKGNGFLRGMIRTLISVCLNYATGKIEWKKMAAALNCTADPGPDFRKPVPANGLYFKRGYFRDQ